MNEYTKQAEDFLKSTNTDLDIVFLYTGPYFNDEKRDVYQFTLKNEKGMYSAKFGDSIHNTDRRDFAKKARSRSYLQAESISKAKKLGFKLTRSDYIYPKERAAAMRKPNAYDILACIGSQYPDTFEDFCSEFGYNENKLSDYPKIIEIFNTCKKEEKGMKNIFTPEQIEQLADIQ